MPTLDSVFLIFTYGITLCFFMHLLQKNVYVSFVLEGLVLLSLA